MFEQVATQQDWSLEIWVTQLAGLLTGDALDVFFSVPPGASNKYKEVKAAISDRFEVNAETYWQRFLRAAKKQGKSFKGFLGRLDDNLTRCCLGTGYEGDGTTGAVLGDASPRDACKGDGEKT